MQPSTFISSPFVLTLLTLSAPFLQSVAAAKPSTLTTSTIAAATKSTTSPSLHTNSADSSSALSGSLDSGSWSSTTDSSASASSSSAAKPQWIQINTPMGKITTCSTIVLSWTSGNLNGPLELDLVSATSGDVTVIDSSINISNLTSYKWLVNVPADTYYLEGNVADLSYLVYSGNFTVTQGSTSCSKSASSASASTSASAAKSSVTATASPSGSTFNSGAGKVTVSCMSIASLAILAAAFLPVILLLGF